MTAAIGLAIAAKMEVWVSICFPSLRHILRAATCRRRKEQMVKPREPRRKVVVPARMQAGGRWRDVCILDISSRGLLLHSSDAPSAGSYLEIRRGQHVMVARVVWSEASRFGVHTQDRLPVEAIVRDLPPAGAGPAGSGFVERRH